MRLCKAFANGSSANKKLSKIQLHKIGQSRGFLGRILGPLLKTVFHLMKNVLKPLPKTVLIPSGSTAPASATDAAIHKKMFGSGMTILIISNEEMNDIMELVKSLEESGSLIKCFSKTIKNETKKQKVRFFSMLLDTLGASLLGNLLTGRGVMSAGEGAIRAAEGTIKAGEDS